MPRRANARKGNPGMNQDEVCEPDEGLVFVEVNHTAPKFEIITIETEDDDKDAVVPDDADDDVMDITDEVKAEEERKRKRKSIYYTRAGEMDFKNKKYELAVRHFKRSIDEGSLNYVNFLLKSRAEYNLDNLQEACNDARDAIKMALRNGSVIAYKCHIWLLEMKMSMGESECSKKLIENIKRLYKDDIEEDLGAVEFKRLVIDFEKLNNHISLLKTIQNPEEIKINCLEAIKFAPKCASLYLALAKAYIETEHYLEARSACVSALKLNEECYRAKYYQLQSFYMSGCLKEAMQVYQEVMRRTTDTPKDFEEFKGIGALLEESDNIKYLAKSYKYDEIKDSLFNCQKIINSSSALKNCKLEAAICFKLAVVYNETRNYKVALEWCKKSVERDLNNVQAFILKGDIEMKEESYTDAYKSYRSAETLNKFNLEVTKKVALLSQLNDLPKHYEILGLKTSASNDEISEAYRACILKCDQDKYFGASGDKTMEQNVPKRSEIEKGHAVLINREDRKEHDNKIQELVDAFNSTWRVSSSAFIHSICF